MSFYTVGIDIGSQSTKTVILCDREIAAWKVEQTGTDAAESARRMLDSVLAGIGLFPQNVRCLIATGYGRINIPFADATVTEISCHAKGANYVIPSVRLILDIGGQDTKAIRCDRQGRVTNFAMNDKCAAGTGRYLDRVATTLKIPVENIGPFSLKAKGPPVRISSTCSVFAQFDVLRQVRKGVPVNDILAGACDAVANRVIELVDRIGVDEDFVMTGGVAKNVGVVKRLEEKLQVKIKISEEPQIVGALGAALLAFEKFSNEGRSCTQAPRVPDNPTSGGTAPHGFPEL
jgi:predicted CoA-substrate-specific enzyme activase